MSIGVNKCSRFFECLVIILTSAEIDILSNVVLFSDVECEVFEGNI